MDRRSDRRHWQVLILLAMLGGCSAAGSSRTVFIQEPFDRPNLSDAGWYDNVRMLLSPENATGTGSSLEYKFAAGSTKPSSGSPLRHKFAPSDAVYLSCYVKYSATWVGSGKPYHPHEFHFLTTLDDDWAGLSFTHLTLYVEQNGGTPLIAIQDGRNVDQTRVGQNLTSETEQRAVAGCNGSSDGPDNCYRAADGYVNEKKWKAPSKLFGDGGWHFIEAYVRLNSIAGGKGVSDGVVQYWFDRQLAIDRHDVLLRTGANPSMRFNQFVIAPYIGDGSPIAQSLWIDELTVANTRP